MSVKRAAIYVIYDKDGKLDRYRKYYLEKIRKFCDKIVCVIQGTLEPESRRELENLCDDFFVRENTGLLTYPWIEGINFIGWDALKDYDELLMLNDSFFGPFFELDDFFNSCEKSDADFYGVMKNFPEKSYKIIDGRPLKHGYFRGSICYFYVIKNRLLHSKEFKNYWENKPIINKDWDTYFFNEISFYDEVIDWGFKVDAYQTDKLKGYFFDNLTHNMSKLIQQDKIPFARIRPFATDLKFQSMQIGYGKDPRQTLDYLQNNSTYDTSMIWDYILRTKNLTHIWNQLQLEYVISEKHLENDYDYDKKIAVILHIYYTDLVEHLANYCINFPENTDFYITTINKDTEEKINKVFSQNKFNFICKRRKNIGVAMSSLWVTYADVISSEKYEYVCYFHDKKSPYGQFGIQGEQFATRCYENLFGSKEVVKNIINLFENNKRMGVLGAPIPYHGGYYLAAFSGWKGNYEKTKFLAEKLDLHVNIDPNVMPVAPYGDMFWFRSKALKKAIDHNLTFDDFDEPYKPDFTIMHAFERIYSFCAQDSGYYYADVITADNARSDLINYQYLIYELYKKTLSNTNQTMSLNNSQELSNTIGILNQQIQGLNQYAQSLNQNIAVQNQVISSFKTDHLIKRHLKSDLRKSEIKSKLFFFWPSKKSHYLGKIKKCKYMLSLMEQ